MATEESKELALRSDPTAALAVIEHGIQQSISAISKAKQLVDLATKGGKAAGWGMVGSAYGLCVAVILHAPQVLVFTTAGFLFGLGIFAIRFFQKFRTLDHDALSDELRDVNTMLLMRIITDEEHKRMRASILKKYGYHL